VKVGLAGIVATVLSVSATEIQCLPNPGIASGCTDVTGAMTVTNIDTGDSASGQTFTYAVKSAAPVIQSVTTPVSITPPLVAALPNGQILGTVPNVITVTGFNLFNAVVTFAGQNISATVNATGTSLTFTAPPLTAVPGACPTGVVAPGPVASGSPVDITITNGSTTCSTSFKGAIQYMLPCT